MSVSKQLIAKIKHQVQAVKSDMQRILTAHENKSKLNRSIVDRIKHRGNRYQHDFAKDKKRLIEIISDQEGQLHGVLDTLDHIDRLLELIINTERVSLLIDQRKRYGGISGLVDPITEPLDNFKNEIDEIKVIRDSFEVLKIELEKQKEYVRHFDLEPDDVDEEYFRKSEEYEATLSDQELVSLTHLSAFCDALESQLTGRLKSEKKVGSDQVTLSMIKELSSTRLAGSLSPSFKRFLDRYVKRVIGDKTFTRTFVLSFVFLLSRLAYFEKTRFRHSIFLARFAYATAPAAGFEADQRDALVLAAMASDLQYFAEPTPKGDSIDSSERDVLARYYHLVKSTFISKIPFLETIRQEATRPGDDEATTWPIQAGRFLAALQRSERIIAEKGPSVERVSRALSKTLDAHANPKLARAIVEAHTRLTAHGSSAQKPPAPTSASRAPRRAAPHERSKLDK